MQSFLGESYYPPPHKRLLTRVRHSFPIVLLARQSNQSPLRHCLTKTNQINRYNVRFCISRDCFCSEMLVPGSWNIFFTSRMANYGWNIGKNILRVIESVSCATLLSHCRSKEFEFSDKALLILLAWSNGWSVKTAALLKLLEPMQCEGI